MSRTFWFRILLLCAIVTIVAAGLYWRDDLAVSVLRGRLDDLGAWAPLAFMAAYALGALAFLPGAIFTIASGVLFGPWWGTVYALLGATLGATLAFLAARYAAAEWVAERSGGLLRRVIVGVEHEGWRFVAFTRLVPLFPFNLLNYALGLTRISLAQYVLATLICMAPAAAAYVWIGHAGAEAIAGGERAVQTVLIALGLLAAVLFLPRLIRRIRRDPVPGVDDEPTDESDPKGEA